MSKIIQKAPEKLFQITELLGEGSFANVYKGISLDDKKEVAIKILPLPEEFSEIQREIDILHKCRNPNIVEYYGCYHDRESESFWVVMEYCQAGSISDLMGICNLLPTEAQIAIIMREIIIGVAYLHKMNMIHRDIKAGNILLNSNGDVKITDFGVSATLASAYSKRSTVIGTPYWMAPEVLMENQYDRKADIWSIGITAIELATGTAPHSELNPLKAAFVIPKKAPPSLPNKFSKKFRSFVKIILQKNPHNRPEAAELLKDPFIRSAGSKSILKKLYDQCIPTILKYRAEFETQPEKESSEQTKKKKQMTVVRREKGCAKTSSKAEKAASAPANTGTVQINSGLVATAAAEDDEDDEAWEKSLRFDSPSSEEMDYDDFSNGTMLLGKPDVERDENMEKFDFTEPRALDKSSDHKYKTRDTFEFYGKVPLRGHKYVADYYGSLSLSQMNTIMMDMEKALAEQHRQLEANYKTEKNILEYAIRVKKGEQTVRIRE